MTRVFVDFSPQEYLVSEPDFSSLLELDRELSHHIKNVLRYGEGKQLSVVCRQSGEEFLAIVASTAIDAPVKIQIVKKLDRQIRVPVIASLACGLPKGSHPDQICEQVSQLGVERIIFWQADRSVAQPKQGSAKLERWQKIAEISARQSQQNKVPELFLLESSRQFYTFLKEKVLAQDDLLALCSLRADAKPIAESVKPVGRAHLLVGPEGDFSEQELQEFVKLGARHFSLGPLVLRVETAAVVGVSMGLAAWGWKTTN